MLTFSYSKTILNLIHIFPFLAFFVFFHLLGTVASLLLCVLSSFSDPDPPIPHVFGPPGSGSTSQRCGSGSSSKNSKKNFIPTVM
jgi:hypothetical protein